MSNEPTLILYAILAGLNTAQTLTIPMPAWVHALIIVATSVLTALLNRAVVIPTNKVKGP